MLLMLMLMLIAMTMPRSIHQRRNSPPTTHVFLNRSCLHRVA